MNIRKEASKILDIYIGEGKWDYIIEQLDREGKMTKKRELELILMLCKKVEELENQIILLTPKEAPHDTPTVGA